VAQNNVIELNGKKYDALSGTLLGESRVKATAAARATSQRGRVIDGFVRPTNHQHHNTTVIKPQPVKKPSTQPSTLKKTVTKPTKNMDVKRAASAKSNVQPHQPERPKTLMRHVVKKPDVTIKPAIKTANPSEVMAAPKGTIAKPLEKKLSASNVNPFRLARSRHVSRSHHIHRFEQTRQNTHPAANRQPVNRAVRQTQPSTPQVVVNTSVAPAVSTAQAQPQHSENNSSSDIFEAALAHATSHEQTHMPPTKHRSRRFVNIMAGVGAFLLIAGFAAYMNMTNIELHVASMRAGFHAQLPHYQPEGYAMDGGIESGRGRVAMNFRSGTSRYTITQEASDWKITTLLDQTTTERGKPTQTIESNGRTIYIYDDSNATWVDGGVRYQISGNASLNADDLVSLATSM
jgi:hypothetical protein